MLVLNKKRNKSKVKTAGKTTGIGPEFYNVLHNSPTPPNSVFAVFILCFNTSLNLPFIFIQFLSGSFASLDVKPSNQGNRVTQLDQSVSENSLPSEIVGQGQETDTAV